MEINILQKIPSEIAKFKFYPSVWTKISVCLLFQVHSKIFFTS